VTSITSPFPIVTLHWLAFWSYFLSWTYTRCYMTQFIVCLVVRQKRAKQPYFQGHRVTLHDIEHLRLSLFLNVLWIYNNGIQLHKIPAIWRKITNNKAWYAHFKSTVPCMPLAFRSQGQHCENALQYNKVEFLALISNFCKKPTRQTKFNT